MLQVGDRVYLFRKNIKTKRLSNKLDYKKLRLFKIKQVRSILNYELILSKIIKIYLVFYILLFEIILKGAPPAPRTEIELINLNAEYEVEKVLDYNKRNSTIKYLIK